MAARILVEMPGKQLLERRLGDSRVIARADTDLQSLERVSRVALDTAWEMWLKRKKLRGQQG